MTMKTNIYRLMGCGVMAAAVSSVSLTGCQDFFEQDSDRIIFADGGHLNNPTDTVYSMVGILQKMQALADRSVLLGEVRGDLVDVNEYTSADLRDIALFELDDSANVYNQPRDYYAVINNCNYYIARADTALKDNRNEKVFMREYAAAKTFRAWTYLQLVLAYGKVPFVTEPILLSGDLERDYPKLEVKDICEWLISDLVPVADEDIPLFNGLSVDSRLAYVPHSGITVISRCATVSSLHTLWARMVRLGTGMKRIIKVGATVIVACLRLKGMPQMRNSFR